MTGSPAVVEEKRRRKASPPACAMAQVTQLSQLTAVTSRVVTVASTYPDTTHHCFCVQLPVLPCTVPQPRTPSYTDRWDSRHVRLPCSPDNKYPVPDPERPGQSIITSRWDLVTESLLSPMQASSDLEQTILRYNSRYSDKWNFQLLHKFFNECPGGFDAQNFFEVQLPSMAQLASNIQHIVTQPLPLLQKQCNSSITLSQHQVAALLANAFFCTFPRRNATQKQSEYSLYPTINMNRLFEEPRNDRRRDSCKHKLACIMNYFRRVTTEAPCGVLTFTRRSVSAFPDWSSSTKPLTRLHVNAEGLLDREGSRLLQVDFANKLVGGGALSSGCVQEEIRFMTAPELIVSRLFTEQLDDNECLVITGFETYNKTKGYSDTFRFVGDHCDSTPRDEWGRRLTRLVAIDALRFDRPTDTFKPENILRELNKAYCGFSESEGHVDVEAIATGNWGCGAFNGEHRTKALIQLMAAAEAGRDVAYFTFNHGRLDAELIAIHGHITERGLTVGDIWKLLHQFSTKMEELKKMATSGSKGQQKSKQRVLESLNVYSFIQSPEGYSATLAGAMSGGSPGKGGRGPS